MAGNRSIMTLDQLTSEIDEQLRTFRADAPSLSLRNKVLRLVDLQRSFRTLNIVVGIQEGLSDSSPKARIRTYFLQHPAVVIDTKELGIVSGITDYPRRVRELRVEEGYRIATGASPDAFSGISLKPTQYLLTTTTPDGDLSRRWHVANRIRRMTTSVQDRILKFLKENVGRVVTTEELAYVAKDRRDYGRRTRELRTEEGYAIATRFSGRPDLLMGEYVLLSVDRIAEPHDRHIPDGVQKEVYIRDQNTCRNPSCSYKWIASDPRILELHHINPHSNRGSKRLSGKLALCCQRVTADRSLTA